MSPVVVSPMKLAILAFGLFSAAAFGQSSPRMFCVFLDLGSMSPAEQIKAEAAAASFIQDKAAPSDLIEIATFTSKFNVIQDFTGDRGSLLAVLKNMEPVPANADPTGRAEAIQAAKATLVQPERQGDLIWVTRPAGTPDYMAALNTLRFSASAQQSIGVSLLPIER